MRIVEIVARYLLGIMFTVFGLNGFLNFIHQPPPPNPLADATGLSVSHFSRMFRASTGLSPHQFLLQRRVHRGRDLIRESNSNSH